MKGQESEKNSFTNNLKKDISGSISITVLIVLIVLIPIVTLSCVLLNNKRTYNITFDSNGGSLIEAIEVNANDTILEPEDPIRDGYVFAGWYYNGALYNFNTPVTSDIKLAAEWSVLERVSSVTIEDTELILGLGKTSKLTATVLPENARNKKVFWKSSAPDIVSVDSDGNIKALKEGSAIITVTTEDGGYTAETKVFVNGAIINGNGESEEKDKTDTTKNDTTKNDTTKNDTTKNDTTKNDTTKNDTTKNDTTNNDTTNNDTTNKEPEVVKTYTVTFKDEDGKTLSDTQTVENGKNAVEPASPTKVGNTFQGWYNGEIKYEFTEPVTGDINLTARWTKNKYTITFLDEDGSVLETKTVEYGEMPISEVTPTKESNEQYTYTFAGWTPSVTKVEKDITYTATYTKTLNKYKVSFVDENGIIILDSQTVQYGDMAIEPEKPTKQGHTFQAWYNGDAEYKFTETITGDITLTAKWTKNKYTVVFVNDDGAVLERKILEYGSVPTYTKTLPTKAGNKTYTYLFKGWDKEIAAITEDVIYRAIYETQYIDYVIKFMNEDGTELSNKTYHYGETVEQPEIPSKPADEMYTYTFAGWNSNVTTVEKDMTYIATYHKALNIYEINFVDEDGTQLSSTQTVQYGNKVTEPKDPKKKGHIFQGWYNEETKYEFIETVTKNVILTAKWTKIKYTITFENYNGTVLETNMVEYGEIPVYKGETPTKPGNAQYTYTFKEWNPSVVKVEQDATYTATYTAKLNSYTVTFVDENELASSQKVEYGKNAIEPTRPTKMGHTFQGWYNGETKYTFTEKVTGDITLTAKWEKDKYTVTFVNYDGSVLETKTLDYGEQITYTGATPTKLADNTYTYSFKDWDKELENIKENITYIATYTAKYIDYVIKFVDENGKVLSEKTYHYGENVKQPEAPTKTADAQYIYVFAGWTPSVTTVKGNTTYTVTYSKTLRSYTVRFVDENGDELASSQTVEYGKNAIEPTRPTKIGHTFKGWYNGLIKYTFAKKVTGDITLTAKWEKDKCTVTFVNDDGFVLETKKLNYGEQITYTGATPTKSADKTYTYSFKGWDKELGNIKEDITYTATYTAKYIDYVIKFVDENEKVLSEKTYHYGEIVKQPEAPTKTADAQYTYIFAGWSPNIITVKENATYKATYSKALRSYTVKFVDENGNELASSQKVEYGKNAIEPTKPNKTGYAFQGWYNGTVKYTFTEKVTGDITLTAKWEKDKYTVTFVNYNGSVLETKELSYGEQITYTGATPTKAADNTYTYSFKGWDKELGNIKEDITYTATYTAKYIDYVIKFVDENGKVLSEKTYHYGETVKQPEAPTKAADAQYTYAFAGWTPSVITVNGNATYKATYTKTVKSYTVKFVDENGNELANSQIVKYGEKAKKPEQTPTKESYVFEGWYNGKTKYEFTETVTGNITLTAKFAKRKYTITFKNYDGSVLATTQAEEGTWPAYTGKVPTRETDSIYSYRFIGWTPRVTEAVKDEVYTATFNSYIDVDQKVDKAIAGVKVSEFNTTRTNKTIDVKFNGRYKVLNLAEGVVGLLNGLASDPSYKSVTVTYRGKSLNAKNYTTSDALDWLTHLCGQSSSLGMLSATTDNLVGKKVRIDIKLQDQYYLENGLQWAMYNLTFSQK